MNGATNTKAKQPYLIRMIDQASFAFAGLWERWRDKARGDVIESCTIVTCPRNAVSAPIHDLMPAILTKEDYAAWLGETEATPEQLRAMAEAVSCGSDGSGADQHEDQQREERRA